MTPMGPFDRLGRFVVRHARLVVAAWAVLIVVALRMLIPRRTELTTEDTLIGRVPEQD